MSEKSFIEKIQLKASIKIFIILTILSVLFFTFWYIIKPEAYKKFYLFSVFNTAFAKRFINRCFLSNEKHVGIVPHFNRCFARCKIQ